MEKYGIFYDQIKIDRIKNMKQEENHNFKIP